MIEIQKGRAWLFKWRSWLSGAGVTPVSTQGNTSAGATFPVPPVLPGLLVLPHTSAGHSGRGVLSAPLQPECLGSGKRRRLPRSIQVTMLMCILRPPALEHGAGSGMAPGGFHSQWIVQSMSPLESQQNKLVVKESTELAFFSKRENFVLFLPVLMSFSTPICLCMLEILPLTFQTEIFKN